MLEVKAGCISKWSYETRSNGLAFSACVTGKNNKWNRCKLRLSAKLVVQLKFSPAVTLIKLLVLINFNMINLSECSLQGLRPAAFSLKYPNIRDGNWLKRQEFYLRILEWSIIRKDSFNINTSFLEGRNTTISFHLARAGVVCGHSQDFISVKGGKHLF